MELLLLFAAGLLTGLALCWLRARMAFQGQDAEDYNSSSKTLDLREHLNGPMICEGVIFGPFGRVSSRFVANFDGTWDGNKGELKEHFVYSDGQTQDRVWSITMGEEGCITARAPDVVGHAKGHIAGSAMGLSYRLKLPETSGGHVLDAVDWMYLLDNGTIVNRSQFRKFGITVAELVATIRPVASEASKSGTIETMKTTEHERTAA